MIRIATRPNKDGYRKIYVKNKHVGEVTRIPESGFYEAHWQGEVRLSGERWMVSEEKICDVKKRVKAAIERGRLLAIYN